MVLAEWETVVGLECHIQLLTDSKLFSPARSRYGDPPNTNVDVVDVGLPGVLPVVNDKAVSLAVRLGLALGCRVRERSTFARKHYFYPDLPKGYQISQYDEPICEGGGLVIESAEGEREVPLTRIHLEEDAGKNIHDAEAGVSFVDYNRAGTPLLELVTEPALASAEEAMAFLRALRSLVVALGVCDGNMQEGSLRADANVSVRRRGETALGQRTETKNLNSVRFLGQAIEAEARRQVQQLEAGRAIVQETRLWDSVKRESRSMRSKEEAHDYRYMLDPDLLPLVVTPAEIEQARAALPELPREKRRRYVDELGLSDDDARTLTSDFAVARYFEEALAAHKSPKAVANWVMGEVLRVAKERRADDETEGTGLEAVGIAPAAIGELVRLIEEGVLTGKLAKQVFAELEAGRGTDPGRIAEDKGWRVQRDEGALRALVDEVMARNPKEGAAYRGGKAKALGFFVGQVMKATKGQADPQDVNRLLKEAFGEPG